MQVWQVVSQRLNHFLFLSQDDLRRTGLAEIAYYHEARV